MVKKMKRVAGASSSSFPVDEEAKNRFKIQSLMQDFNELREETEGLRQNLRITKRRKSTLSAEVRFLRRRFQYLLRTSSQTTSPEHLVQPKIQGILKEPCVVKQKRYKDKEKRNPPAMVNLNEPSDQGEERREFQVVWEPLRMDKKLKRCSIEGDDLKLSICRDVGKGTNKTGKRKITWQDQVALIA